MKFDGPNPAILVIASGFTIDLCGNSIIPTNDTPNTDGIQLAEGFIL